MKKKNKDAKTPFYYFRKSLGYTQDEMSLYFKIAQGQVSKLENGHASNIELKIIHKLLDSGRINLHAFFEEYFKSGKKLKKE